MALFVMKLMSFIPGGDVCEQYQLRQKIRGEIRVNNSIVLLVFDRGSKEAYVG
jgi:hypothetical protein